MVMKAQNLFLRLYKCIQIYTWHLYIESLMSVEWFDIKCMRLTSAPTVLCEMFKLKFIKIMVLRIIMTLRKVDIFYRYLLRKNHKYQMSIINNNSSKRVKIFWKFYRMQNAKINKHLMNIYIYIIYVASTARSLALVVISEDVCYGN